MGSVPSYLYISMYVFPVGMYKEQALTFEPFVADPVLRIVATVNGKPLIFAPTVPVPLVTTLKTAFTYTNRPIFV